jgi:Fe-S cluster assembly protein SufD
MSAVAATQSAATRYGRLVEARLAGSADRLTEWLRDARKQAARQFAATGFPTAKAEAWRYTPLQGLLEREFQLGAESFSALGLDDIEDLLLRGTHARLVFVNGRYAPALSQPATTSGTVRVGSLSEALRADDARPPEQDGEAAHAFTTLNTALFEDGAHVHVPDGERLETPLELLFVSVGLDEPAMHHPRNLISLGAGASATIVERYASIGPSLYFTNALTDLSLGEGARLEHLRVQEESDTAYHMGGVRLLQARDSGYAGVAVTLGGAWSRCEHRVDFAGPGASFELDGLYLAGDGQFVDHHLDIRHGVPGCRSRETFKGLLHGAGRAVFDGRIVVEKDAQKTDAALNNANLLLSRNAEVDTKPQLEIYADDVKCSHGAAVGQIQPAELFYLRSRGIPEAQARQLLCLGFAQEVLDACSLPALRTRLEAAVARQLGSAARSA